jgi:outer membrane murein-binding lipoprotein Lpp
MSADDDRTASLMTPAKLAQLKVRPAPAASPAAWLDQMAADAGSGHVRRLAELRAQLEAQLRVEEDAPFAAARDALAQALDQLDFAQVQPKGWLARATGKGKEAVAGFLAQADRAQHAAEDLEQEARSLQRKWQAPAGGNDRAVVEMEVEVRAIEKIMDQGARWLQDMRNQIRERQAASTDEAVQQQAREDSARCELLVTRLKLLRATSAAMQQALVRCKALPARRQAVLEALQQVQEGEVRRWHKKLARVVDQATATGSAAEGIDSAERAVQELRAALDQLARDGEALRAHQQSAADELGAASAPLQAAA